MKRASSRRRLRVFALILGVPVLVLGPWAYAATSAADAPRITFTATGTPPVLCGSRPNVTSLLIKHGTKIIIANLTGVRATINVGRRKLVELADGAGALIRLRRGQHELRMTPQCVVVRETDRAVVNVLTGAQLNEQTSLTPSPAGDPDDPEESTVTVSGESASPTASSSGGAARTETPTATTLPGVGPTAGPVLEGSEDGLDAEVLEVEAIQFDRTDPKGLRLLGAIATICVLGVTAAIIRAIVSERTSRPVG